MEADFTVNTKFTIPGQELVLTFVRSSGPGGQNVNKVNTKAVLRWHVAATIGLPEPVRDRFLAAYARRITSAGELLLTSQRYRDQIRNVDDCLEKLREMILAIAVPPKKRRPTRVSAAQKAKRLESKRKQSERKQSRRRPTDE